MTMLRHALSVLLLPTKVVVAVPRWLLRRTAGAGWRLLEAAPPVTATLLQLLGALLFTAGLVLVAWCIALFARVGQGTLAPWDPTRRLVVRGPYRHVRNPMISGVALMLAGEAAFTRSLALAAWLALFVAINHGYFLLSEEPGLVRRFGAEYERCRRAVPRWWPRRAAWADEAGQPQREPPGARRGAH